MRVAQVLGSAAAIVCCTVAGTGIYVQSPLVVLQVPAVLFLLVAWPPAEERWLWTVTKFILAWACLALGVALGFLGATRSKMPVVVAMACAETALLVLFVYVPFYRMHRLVSDKASALGHLLLGVAFACAHSAFWFLLTLNPITGDFVQPAYGLVTCAPIIGFAAVLGMTGVMFVVSLAGVALFAHVEPHKSARGRASHTVLSNVAAVVVCVAIACSVASAAAAGGVLRGVARSDLPANQARALCMINADGAKTRAAMDAAAKSGTPYDLILWSEESTRIDTVGELRALANLTRAGGPVIGVAYANHSAANGRLFNMAALLVDGAVAYTYAKRHPVMLDEANTTPGPGRMYAAPTALGSLSMAICFDLNFAMYVSGALPPATDVLLQPSETWGAIGNYHAHVNAVRAIELGVLLVRCSSDGYSGVFHPSGQWQAFVQDATRGSYEFTMLRNFRRVFTLYTYVGVPFAWLIVGMAAVLLVVALLPAVVLRKMLHALPGCASALCDGHAYELARVGNVQ